MASSLAWMEKRKQKTEIGRIAGLWSGTKQPDMKIEVDNQPVAFQPQSGRENRKDRMTTTGRMSRVSRGRLVFKYTRRAALVVWQQREVVVESSPQSSQPG